MIILFFIIVFAIDPKIGFIFLAYELIRLYQLLKTKALIDRELEKLIK